MPTHAFFKKMEHYKEMSFAIFNDQYYSYSWLCERVDYYCNLLNKEGIQGGELVEFIADYSPESIAVFLALTHMSAIIMPLTNITLEKKAEYEATVRPGFIIHVDSNQEIRTTSTSLTSSHDLILEIRKRKNPGLIILSSGSTGKSKAIVHDFSLLINKLSSSQKRLNVLSFLLFDHIGGINTVLNALFSGNCLVIPPNKTPGAVSKSINKHKVDVLITSPSFLNLMMLNGVFGRYDFSCLKQINYGSEVMPSILLERLVTNLPDAQFNQAYGLSELGVIRTRTNNKKSNLIRIEDQSIEYRIIDGMLEIKSNTSMLGYLNAPNPFTHDGWFKTEDIVEQIGNELKIIGRNSDIINVGGEKVFPAEIENVLLELPDVEEVMVSGESNQILGNIVVAQIKIKADTNEANFTKIARQFCREKLPKFKVPQKFIFVTAFTYSNRFKKVRNTILK